MRAVKQQYSENRFLTEGFTIPSKTYDKVSKQLYYIVGAPFIVPRGLTPSKKTGPSFVTPPINDDFETSHSSLLFQVS